VGVRSGAGNVLQEVRLRAYYNRLWEHVNAHWTIPPSLVGRGHTVIVSAAIDRRGRLLKATVEEPSASPAFDQSALRALERAVPLPAFPEEVAEDVLEIGFRFHGD
jgi:TonB family protein